LAKVVLEPVTIDINAQSPFETFNIGLESTTLIDTLNLELKGVKTFHARDWRRKYEKKFGKQEV
jgi:hypothetical protein